jgi:hypothetical protein
MKHNTSRRDVLRKTGLAIAGTTALSGTALADGDGADPRPEPVAGSLSNWNSRWNKVMPWNDDYSTADTGEWIIHDVGWGFEPELDEGGREYARQWVEDTTDVITIDGEVFEDDDFRWSEPEEAEEDYIGTHIHWQFSTPPKEPGEYWFEWECYKDGEPVYDFFPLGQYITVEEGTHDGHDHDDQ